MWFWIPLLGPTIGAVLGALLYKLFIEIHWPAEDIKLITIEEVKLITASEKQKL
jgi:hypothetical protein